MAQQEIQLLITLKIILFFCLDSDNILEPNSIKKLKNYLKKYNSDVCSFQEIIFFKKNIKNISSKWKFNNNSYNKDNYLSSIYVPGASGNYLFKKETWLKSKGYPEYTFLDTWGFGFRQIMNGFTIDVVPNTKYFHRIGIESYWVRETKNKNSSIEATRIILEFFDKISDRSIDYIFSKKNRYKWFEELDKKQIFLKNNKPIKITYFFKKIMKALRK